MRGRSSGSFATATDALTAGLEALLISMTSAEAELRPESARAVRSRLQELLERLDTEDVPPSAAPSSAQLA